MGRITAGPTRWPPRARRRLVLESSNLKPETCNWYLNYIPNYASLTAPLMDSLAGKYKGNPDKRTSKVRVHKQTISGTHLMRENFEKIKTSLCEACSLYIPSDKG